MGTAEGKSASRPARAWQRMLSGRRLDILDPSPLDIEITDIALGLSRVARWNGQSSGPHGFSVAQHCLLVVELLARRRAATPPRLLLAGLLHDAPEYVMSDLITPFKNAVGGRYREIEERMDRAVHLAFGLPAVLPVAWTRAIKAADRAAAFHEAVSLAGFGEAEAREIFGHHRRDPVMPLAPWPAEQARLAYLEKFAALRESPARP